MEDALGASVRESYLARDLLCVLEDEETVRDLAPDFEKIKQIDGLLVHVTARGSREDCVSRSFAPKLSVSEDPVCGSGHCHIIPYWASVLGRMNWLPIRLPNAARRCIAAGMETRFLWPARRRCIPSTSCL